MSEGELEVFPELYRIALHEANGRARSANRRPSAVEPPHDTRDHDVLRNRSFSTSTHLSIHHNSGRKRLSAWLPLRRLVVTWISPSSVHVAAGSPHDLFHRTANKPTYYFTSSRTPASVRKVSASSHCPAPVVPFLRACCKSSSTEVAGTPALRAAAHASFVSLSSTWYASKQSYHGTCTHAHARTAAHPQIHKMHTSGAHAHVMESRCCDTTLRRF